MADSHVQMAIIGAGPGGLGAAMNAAHHKVSHILFEKSELGNTIFDYQLRKHVMAEPSNLPLRSQLPFEAGTREAILESWHTSVKEAGVNVEFAEVTSIEKSGAVFRISHSKGSLTADSVVLAIGMQGTPRKLGVPGEDLPHVAYTLSDPDAFEGRNILVVGAGDSAIENAMGLMEKNSVTILNRKGEFPRAKEANAAAVGKAIESGKLRCYFNSKMLEVTDDSIRVETPDGEVTAACDHIIARIGAILPRKFLESCGIEFTSADRSAIPVVNAQYESNVPGLYIIGALIGYPLIKQAINQGFEVVEHFLGNPVEPADQVIIEEKLGHLPGDVNDNLNKIRDSLRLFRDLSTPQFRELISDSDVRVLKRGQIVFEKDDFTDTFFSVVQGSVAVQLEGGRKVVFGPGNFFGEVGLYSGRRRTATVIVDNDCVLLETKRRQILKLISSVESVKWAIDQVFVLRVLQVAVFPDAEAGSLKKLLSVIKPQNFKKGEVFFHEGDPGERLYVVRKGSVKVSRKNSEGVDVTQTYLPAGNYVGEMALLADEPLPRTATVSAAVPCETFYVERADILEFLELNPGTKERMRKLAEERRVENLIAQQDAQKGELLNFIFKEGITDAENVLIIDSDLCVGCDNCEKACAATHNGYSRLDRKGGESFASIQVPISCRHCENPLCMIDCPPDALERKPDGEIIIKETCIGCGNCQTNCPYGVIQMVYNEPPSSFNLFDWFRPKKEKDKGPAVAAKCDMCEKLGSGPACVRSCPTGAAMRVNPVEMMNIIEGKSR